MADKYVKPAADGGSDGASGNSLASAYATIPFALNAMSANDRLLVKGIFTTSNTTFNNLKSGTSGRTVIEAIDYFSTTLQGSSGNNIVQFPSQTTKVDFKGFYLNGMSNIASFGIKGAADGTDFANESDNLLFEDILIFQTYDSGVKLHASDCTLRRVTARQCGHDPTAGHGFYIGAKDSDNLFEDCEADSCADVGFRNLANTGNGANGNIYRRCYAHHCNFGFYLANTYRAENIIAAYNNAGGVFLVNGKGDADPETGEVYFATIVSNGQDSSTSSPGLGITGSGSVRKVQNCISMGQSNGGANITNTTTATSTTVSNNQDGGTPSTYFADPTNLNFHVNDNATTQSNIDGQGTAISGITTDFDEVTRTNPPDIGAYQIEGAGGDEPPVNSIPTSRTTALNTAFGFDSFTVTHAGDLDQVIVYAESGSFD